MKYLNLILMIVLICFENAVSQSGSAASNLSRKVLATLQTEEGILQDESCFPLGLTGDRFYMVTMLEEKYFIYENGQRSGPFESLEKAGYKPCANSMADNGCNAFKQVQSVPDPELLTMSEDGQFLIKLGEKSFGPYKYIREIHVSEDKSEFVAIVMNADMKSYFVTSGGMKTLLEGEPESLHVSPSGKKYVFVVKEDPNTNPAILNMDFSSMSTEEIMKFAKEQEERAKQTGPPKAWVYTNNTPKLGPFDTQGFYSDNPTFTRTGGDNWIMIIDNSLYINGILKQKMEDIDLSICDIWVSRDGKRFAAAAYDKIVFGDGTVYPYPIKINSLDNAGKIILKWISLENEKDLVLYSREL